MSPRTRVLDDRLGRQSKRPTPPECLAVRNASNWHNSCSTLRPIFITGTRAPCFPIDRLRDDIGWEPQHTFESMVDHTFGWYHDAGLAHTQAVDWGFEDSILATLSHEGE